jgi:hypothetical protein
MIVTGGFQDGGFTMQHITGCLATLGREGTALAEQLGIGGAGTPTRPTDLKTLEEVAPAGTRSPVDLHLHVRRERDHDTFDVTCVLPVCVGLAAVALGRLTKPGVALLGRIPFGVEGTPVAPVVGPVLSEAAVTACVAHGIHTVIGGEAVRGAVDGGQPGVPDWVKYIAVTNLLGAVEAATFKEAQCQKVAREG